MGRMSELAQFKRCGEILIEISESLTEMFSTADEPVKDRAAAEPVKEKPKKAKEPIAKKKIKLVDVKAVFAEKSRAGLTKEVKRLLMKHGADKLSARQREHR